MIKVGDYVVVGYSVDGKFVPVSLDTKITVSNIRKEHLTDRTVIDLDWNGSQKSKVYLHDENKVWRNVSNFN